MSRQGIVSICPRHKQALHSDGRCSLCVLENVGKQEPPTTQTRASDTFQKEAAPPSQPFGPARPPPGPAAAEKMARLAQIRSDRAKTYGPASPCAAATGKVYRALLEAHFQHPLPGDIPPHVVYHMFAVAKLVRACFPFKFNRDNYDDAHNYLDLAMEVDPRATNHEEPEDGESRSTT